MYSGFEGGPYGAVQVGALMELSHMLNKRNKKGQNGRRRLPWKRLMLVMAVIATPLALMLLAGGRGF